MKLRGVLNVVLVIGASLLCIFCSDDSPTEIESPGQGRVLSVPFAAQQTQVWCWAAVSEMILRYYNRPIAQCQILSNWYQGDCCTFPQFCLTTASITQIQQTLAGHGLGSAYLGRALTFSEISSEIDLSQPIIVAYNGSFTGHVVIIYGYDPDGFVYIHDPYYGIFQRVPYGATFSYGGQLRWSETILESVRDTFCQFQCMVYVTAVWSYHEGRTCPALTDT